MKNVLIGLLIVAAGAGVYFFVIKKKKEKPVEQGIKKELIIGKWKGETTTPPDSVLTRFSWEFRKDGSAIYAVGDSLNADTLFYSWKDSLGISIRKSSTDSLGIDYELGKLTADSLELKQNGSNPLILLKSK